MSHRHHTPGHHQTTTWETKSRPPWHAYAPQNPIDYLWNEFQDANGRLDELEQRVEYLETQDYRWRTLRKISMTLLRFVWTDGGRILVFLGMLAFAITGITGRLPPALKEAATLLSAKP